MNKRFLKKFYNSQAQFSFTLVICEFANVSLLSENHHMFAKITKNIKNGQTSSFFDFQKPKIHASCTFGQEIQNWSLI